MATTAGASVGGVAGASASAPTAAAVVGATSGVAVLAPLGGAVLAGVSGVAAVGVAGGERLTGGATGTVMPGAVFAVADAALSWFRSSMFLAISCARAAASLACLRWANCSSVDFWPFRAPLDSVSLLGVAVALRLSSVLVCTVPWAERSAAACCVAGATRANLRRNSLKSRLCSAIILRASPVEVASAWSALGSCKTAPALMRLTLP